jgi:ribosomal protein S15P/S13E
VREKQKSNQYSDQLRKKNQKLIRTTKYLSIVTLNVNGLNSTIRKHKLDLKNKLHLLSVCKKYISLANTLKVKGWKTIYKASGSRSKQ